jgi:Asp/Glu/hydantoin racemase
MSQLLGLTPESQDLNQFTMPMTQEIDLSHLFTPTLHGTIDRKIDILLINPNSTHSMTEGCLKTLTPYIPVNCSVTGFTAPYPAPSAIEGYSDAVLSAEACLRALAPLVDKYDAFLVACYSKHPLIDVLREEVFPPVIGIMEASLYAARLVGGRFGIVATGIRSKLNQEEAVRAYGLEPWYVGSETTELGVLELGSQPREIVLARVADATKRLLAKGADCICLGCAGMTDMKEKVVETVALNEGVNVIDGVIVGVELLIAMVRAELWTAKEGVYGIAETRRTNRGQSWL